jgi:O-antigen/teichoic acid export membrane protein
VNGDTDLIQKILTGTRWATLIRLFAQLVSWMSTIFVVRFIAPKDYGLNAMLESPLLFFTFFCTLGLDAALVQRRALSNDELSSAFGFLLLLNGAIFCSFILISPLIASYFNEPELELLAKTMALIFVITPFRVVPNALLDRNLDFKLKAQLELVSTVVAAITTLVMAYLGYGVWALVFGVLVNRILIALLLMIMRPWFIWPTLNLLATKQLLSFGSLVALSSALLMLSDMMITILAGPVIGSVQLGIFAVAAQFALLPLSKGMPILNQTMLPAFSRLQHDPEATRYYLMRLAGVASLVFVPIMVGLASIADMFVYIVIGEKWEESIFPLIAMSIGMIFRMISTLYRSVIMSIGKAGATTKLTACQVIIMLVLAFLATPYGVHMLALAWVLTEAIVMVLTATAGNYLLSTSYGRLYEAIKPSLVAALLMSVVVYSIQYLHMENMHATLATQVVGGAIVYYLIVRYLFKEDYRTAERTLLGRNF